MLLLKASWLSKQFLLTLFSSPLFKWLSTSYTLYTQSRSIAAHTSCFDRLVIQNIFSVNIIYSSSNLLSHHFHFAKRFLKSYSLHTSKIEIERNVFKLFTSHNECQGGKPREHLNIFVGEIFFLITFFASISTIFDCFLVFRLILSVCSRAMKIHFQYFTFQDLNLWIFATLGQIWRSLLAIQIFREEFPIFHDSRSSTYSANWSKDMKRIFSNVKERKLSWKFSFTARENERNFPSARVFSHSGKFVKCAFTFSLFESKFH